MDRADCNQAQPAVDKIAVLEAEVIALRTALRGRQAEIGRLAMENGRLQAALYQVGLEGSSFAGLAARVAREVGDLEAKDAGDCTTCDGTGTAFGKVCACRASVDCQSETGREC